MSTQRDREHLERLLTTHTPVVIICPAGHVHPAGCACGQDPLNHVEHLVNLLAAAGFVSVATARERVLDVFAAERARLTTAERPDPLADDLLGNYLGGIAVAADELTKHGGP